MKKNFKEEYFNGDNCKFSEKLGQKFNNTIEWCKENKDVVMVAAPIIISGVAAVTKMAHKRNTLKKAEDLKQLYCYDRSLGHYWQLKRKLTNNEWIVIDRRKNNGERLADILESMRVLK